MTTKVIIECPSNSHCDIKVSAVNARTKEPFGYAPTIKPGEKQEFYVHFSQSLLIEEVLNDNPSQAKE